MEINGQKIRDLGKRVVAACGLIYKGGKLPVNPSQATVDEINKKVDAIFARLAKPISSESRPVGTFTEVNGGLCEPRREFEGFKLLAGGAV